MAVQREELVMESRAQWREWLGEHASTSPGVWLVTWKRSSGRPVLAYEDLVEEALCVGWVDGQARSRRVAETAGRAARGERANQ